MSDLPSRRPPPQWNPPILSDKEAQAWPLDLQRILGLERLRQEMQRGLGIDPVYQFEKHDDTATADELARQNRFGSGKATKDQLMWLQNQMEQKLDAPQPPFGVEPEPKNINRGGKIALALRTARRHGKQDGGQVDYDMDAAKAAGVQPDERGHMPDTYKLPNHITFSDESKYNDGGAGRWEQINDRWYFTPGPTNLQHHSMEEMRDYFKNHEPDSTLVEPLPSGFRRGGQIKRALQTARRHGGAVKATKAKAHYRLGHGGRQCGKCDMFRPPASCTAVEGKIRTQDTCDFFEKKRHATD
jgi:hypothetical protein